MITFSHTVPQSCRSIIIRSFCLSVARGQKVDAQLQIYMLEFPLQNLFPRYLRTLCLCDLTAPFSVPAGLPSPVSGMAPVPLLAYGSNNINRLQMVTSSHEMASRSLMCAPGSPCIAFFRHGTFRNDVLRILHTDGTMWNRRVYHYLFILHRAYLPSFPLRL